MRVFVVAVLLLWAARADAAGVELVVLASADPALRDALDEALAPAGMTVVVAGDAAPASLGNTLADSRSLADREHATAIVWLISAADPGGGSTLVVYDRDVDRVLVRTLAYIPPLAAEPAAEAARMVRTMLRALRVTPDVDAAPPRAVDAPAIRAEAAAPRPLLQALVAAPTALALDTRAGVRIGGPAEDAALQVAATLIWRPRSIGAALALTVAPASELRTSMFTGRASDDALALLARLPWRVAPRVVVTGSAGVALHLITLEGDLASDGPVSETRLDPALRADAMASFELSPVLDVGLALSVDGLLRRQRYLSGTSEVLLLPRLQATLGLVLTVRIL